VGVSKQIEETYKFLHAKETYGERFSREDLRGASGWSEATFRANLSKKLRPFLITNDDGSLCAQGVKGASLENFANHCSQSIAWARDPGKPRLAPEVEAHVCKARDAALAAVQVYNNPAAYFKSANYVVLMMIAYTSLFHAIFLRDGGDLREKDESGVVKELRPGLPRLKGVLECGAIVLGKQSPAFANLKAMFDVRNQIEHRALPEVDERLDGYCHSLLHNFERLIVTEFSTYYALRTSLVHAIQFAGERRQESMAAVRSVQRTESDRVEELLSEYCKALPLDVLNDPKFCFRVWLVPKLANHQSSADRAIEHLNIDALDAEQRAALQASIVAVRKKDVPTDPYSVCCLWEKDVLAALHKELGPVQYRGSQRAVAGHMLRDALKRTGIDQLTDCCYRPQRAGARSAYGPNVVTRIVELYKLDPCLFDMPLAGR